MKDQITVRYIGPDAAILAGQYILEGETRTVPLARVIEAEAEHPGAFVVVAGTWPATPIELAPIELEQAPTESEQPIEPEPPSDEPEPASEEPLIVVNEPAPTPIINHQPQAHNGRRHEQQRGRGHHGKR